MYERAVVSTNREPEFYPVTSKWGLLAAVLSSPLFFLFAFRGDPGRGRAAMFSGILICITIRIFWSLRKRIWFWIIIIALAILHAVPVLLITWSNKSRSVVALMPIGLLDFVAMFAIIKFIDSITSKSGYPTKK